jgi:tetratricopeptide (TPR) repeat protein
MNGVTCNKGAPIARRLRRTRHAGWLAAFLFASHSLCCGAAQAGAQAPSVHELFEHGQTLAREGRLAESEVLLEKAANLSPDDRAILTLLAKVKSRLSEFPSAISLFQRVIALNPQSAEAHVDLAIALSDSGDLPKALEETARALAIDPRLPSAHLNRARILDDLRREPEAEEEFSIARKLAPNDPEVCYYWSFVERAMGHFDKETSLLQRVVALQPSNEKALILLGKSLIEQSRTTEAETVLRRTLASDPKSADATYMLSRLLITTKPSESRQLAARFAALRQQSANLDRSKSIGNEAYGASLEQDWPRAIDLYKQALQVCGSCEAEEALRRNLGLTLCRSGNTDDGGIELRKALSLNPDDREVVKALSIIGPEHEKR